METFYAEFIADLKDCTASRFHSDPLDHWDPQEVAAPERHLSLGTEDWDECVMTLQNENAAFAQIEGMFHIYFNPTKALIEDTEKEQVWLFAYHWFAKYYEHLMDTRTVHTEFYRKYHDLFLTLLRRCLRLVPQERPTFAVIAGQWLPATFPATFPATASSATTSSATTSSATTSSATTSSATTSSDSATASSATATAPSDSVTATAPSDSVTASSATATASSATVSVPENSQSKRVVLVGERGHNKTRRNLRN